MSEDVVPYRLITPEYSKRVELAEQFFGRQDDRLLNDLCKYALDAYHIWIVSQGWKKVDK